jgi:hypothetical protein
MIIPTSTPESSRSLAIPTLKGRESMVEKRTSFRCFWVPRQTHGDPPQAWTARTGAGKLQQTTIFSLLPAWVWRMGAPANHEFLSLPLAWVSWVSLDPGMGGEELRRTASWLLRLFPFSLPRFPLSSAGDPAAQHRWKTRKTHKTQPKKPISNAQNPFLMPKIRF